MGMGLSFRDLTPDHLEILGAADIVLGGRRHLAQLPESSQRRQVITGRLDETIDFIRSHMKQHRIVVLASGDPLFFGIGDRIVRALGVDAVTVLPNVSSIAAAFARIGIAWSHAGVVSLHGRDRRLQLLEALKKDAPVAVFTDPGQTPGWLAGWLKEKGLGHLRMAVFEQMGTETEAFAWYSLEEAGHRSFADPNVVILQPGGDPPTPGDLCLGMPEAAFDHEKGLITKSDIRAVSLSRLRLRPGQTLWDLGAGSGAMGIEASLLLGPGRIIAVERNPRRVEQIRANAGRMGVINLEAVCAVLPEGLSELPPPDRVFIGGGGRRLPAIIKRAVECMADDGIVVVNTVLMESLTAAVDALENSELTVHALQVQVNHSRHMPWSRRFEAGNPVWIITGTRGRAHG